MTDERLRQIIADLQEWLEERKGAAKQYYTPTIPWEGTFPTGMCGSCAAGGLCGCVRPENTPQCR